MKRIILSLILFTSINSILFSQSNQWVWLKGDKISGVSGVYGMQGMAAPSNKPGARKGSVSWTDAAGGLWMFGGVRSPSDGGGFFNDLWKYNSTTNEWTWVNGDSAVAGYAVYGTLGVPSSGNRPGGRAGSAVWADASGNLWLFGGSGFTSHLSGVLNDLWKYNITTNEWTWMKGDSSTSSFGIYGSVGTASSGNKPGGREQCVGWKDDAGNLWLFGGYGLATRNPFWFLNDLWKYNITTNEWTWIKGDTTFNPDGVYGTRGVASPENRPAGRKVTSSWTDQSGNFWMFGGDRSIFSLLTDYVNDLWKYNISTNEWTWMRGDKTATYGIYNTQGRASDTGEPGSRKESISWTDIEGNFWILGGYGFSTNTNRSIGYLNDLWKYNVITNQWTWVKGDKETNVPGIYGTQGVPAAANKPGGRTWSMSLTDPSGNFGLLSGSVNTINGRDVNMNDLWAYLPMLNEPPLVTITSPVNGSAFNAGSTITVNIDATDADGTIQRIDFYANDFKIGVDSTSPYQFTADHVEAATYIVKARAFDNKGDSAVSNAVRVNVIGCAGTGKITAEGFPNIPGAAITDLTSNPAYPNSPAIVTQFTQLAYGDLGKNYGARLRGYICAPGTSDFVFFITSDDQSELWLSTDANPANKRKIAWVDTWTPLDRGWFWYPSQRSQRIRLTKGGKYYIEILHKQYVGRDHMVVGWEWSGYPNDSARFFEAPIRAHNISPFESSSSIVSAPPGQFREVMGRSGEPVENMNGLIVKVSPNPSVNHFTLNTKSNSNEPLAITMTDISGRVVEKRAQLAANGTIQLGTKLPPGMYFVEVVQENRKERLKLIKE